MAYVEATGLAIIEEAEATGEVARVFAEYKRETRQPFVPNIMKVMANSPTVIISYWSMISSFYQNSILPESLTAMIFYTVAHANSCQYCSAGHEVSCRILGIDEDMLTALVKDLGSVSPERVRAIIEFAIKVARDPKGVNIDDYDKVRDRGVTDEELVEIIFIAAMGNFGDTMADSLKIEVDSATSDVLRRSKQGVIG
jgi:uncharacterized peroxidase-related enzyme